MSVPTEHDDEALPLLFPSTLLSFFRENLSTTAQQIMNHPSPGNAMCVCTCACTGSSCNFPSAFFLSFFFFFLDSEVLENLSQKNLAPPVPDRILLVSYVSAGSTQSQSSQSFISAPTRPENPVFSKCSAQAVLHAVPRVCQFVIARLSYTVRTDCTECLQNNL